MTGRRINRRLDRTVSRKIKKHHQKETPDYISTFVQKTNIMDYDQFTSAFKAVDKILDEQNLLESKKKYQLAPTISLVYGETKCDEKTFTEALLKIKPIYEMAIKTKTKEEYAVCNECLCFTCDEKTERNCTCPCAGYPKSPTITTQCNLRNSMTDSSTI